MEDVTFENGVVTIVGKKYNLVKRGKEQAVQVVELGRWINKYGIPAALGMADDKGNIAFEDGMQLLSKVIEAVSPEALLSLFTTIVGCSDSVTDKYFDVGVLVDALVYVYENQPVVSKVIKRFFSGGSSVDSTESESSTISAQPTVG